jgi:hypothetical protein
MGREFLVPRADCIPCPDRPPPCSCSGDQDCVFINRNCDACSVFKCVAKGSSGPGGKSNGASKGALAGGIVGALIFLGVAVAIFFWYRRKKNLVSFRRKMPQLPQDKPAPAATVLNRPDPTEKMPAKSEYSNSSFTRVYPTSSSNTTIDLDPESQHVANVARNSARSSLPANPFDDNNSIQTTGTEGTNVIPIALVSPDGRASSISPARPVRSPDLNLNLEHVNVSNDSVRQPTGSAVSQISGISGVSSRNSYMSNASYSSDFLNEAPMIVTPNQVLRAVKPEFINAPPSSDHLKPPTAYSKRPSVGSPLAATSFGPIDMSGQSDDESNDSSDPFNDKHASTMASPSASVMTFGQASTPLPDRMSHNSEWETPMLPWAKGDQSDSRPSSMSTQAGTVIEIDHARRVNVGLSQLSDDTSPQSTTFPRSPYRTTMGRIISPLSGGEGGLEEQQQIALAHAQARAQAQGLDLDESRRASGSSFLSAISTSTRADSILESFPFVPPSPISNRPMRSPPVSPLAQQSFSQSQQNSGPPTPAQPATRFGAKEFDERSDSPLPSPPDRRMLGMSTVSQISTASSGLGSFPFQIDSGNDTSTNRTSFATEGRQRASLDTLALTSDLASYPLGFDRDSTVPYSKS